MADSTVATATIGIGVLILASGLVLQEKKEPQDAPPSAVDKAERKIKRELDKETMVVSVRAPLADVIEYLSQYHGIKIKLDKTLPETIAETPMTLEIRRVPLRVGLELILDDVGLTYEIRDGVILVTKPRNRPGEKKDSPD